MWKINDLQFQRFGRLTVVCSTKKRKRIGGHVIWLCRCDCGNLITVIGSHLINGGVKSCGCFRKDKMTILGQKIKHGDSRRNKEMRLYRIWRNMKNRCSNSNNSVFKYYGKKGISVCNEWKNNYQEFRKWALAHGYANDLTIDRIDHNGNYEPSNCQWITRSENARKAARDRKKRRLNFGEHVSRGRP